MRQMDSTFDRRLRGIYAHAQSNGLWKGTYAMENPAEYWAEGTQSWFDTNRANDHDHGPIDTRAELKEYDPDFAALLTEVYGDGPWRYQRPEARPEAERAHLAGFDRAAAPAFSWPARAPKLDAAGHALAWLTPDQLPHASPHATQDTVHVTFVNRRSTNVRVEWIGFEGRRRAYATIRPGTSSVLTTYPGHAWIISADGVDLGGAVAADTDGSLVIR